MAKTPKKTSKTKTDADINLDDLDELGDLGLDMDFGDEEGMDDENRKPSRAKVLTDLGRQAGEGALEEVIKNTAKKALPEEYSANYHEAMDIASFTSEVVSKNKQALNKSGYRLGKEVKKILPFKVGLLDKYLESQQSQFESFKNQTEEQLREAGIASETASIFDKQLDVQKSLYARTEAQNEIDGRERLIQNKLSQDVLTNMDGNIAHQTAFMTQISKEYYKRSLELQYKSFYVQADSLKTMREYYKAFTIQFTNIEKNTSLPDFVKLKNTEALQEVLRAQAVQSVYGNLVGNNKYLASMKKKVSGMVDEKVEKVTTGMDGTADMLGMINSSSEGMGGSPLSMIAGVASSFLGTAAGKKLTDMLPADTFDKIKNNTTVKTGANYMNMLGTSPSSLVEALKQKTSQAAADNEDQATPGRFVTNKIASGLNTFLNLATPDAENNEVKREGYLTHNQPAIFDKNVHRSITEVIPLYLSRILKTNSDLTSMYSQTHGKIQGNTKTLMYDYEGRDLTSKEQLSENIKNKVFNENAVAPRAKMLSNNILADTYNTASKKEGADKKAMKNLKGYLDQKSNKDMLSSYVERAAKATDGKLDFKTLFEDYENNEKLKLLVESNKGLKKLLDTIKDNKPESTGGVDLRLKDITKDYPLEPVKMLFLKVSEQNPSAPPHKLGDEAATTFSRVFAGFITSTNKDITPQGILDPKNPIFERRLLQKDKTPAFDLALSIFFHDVKWVMQNGDSYQKSYTEYLFSALSNSIRQGKDSNTKVFQNLGDLVPSIVGQGKLRIQNYREGSLRVGEDDEDYVGYADLVELGARRPVEVREDREDQIRSNILSRSIDSMNEKRKTMVKAFNDNKTDLPKAASLIMDSLKESATELSKTLKSKGNDLAKEMKELGITVQSIEKGALNATIAKYDTVILKMEAYIEDIQKGLADVSAEVNEAEQDLTELLQDGTRSTKAQKFNKAMQEASKKTLGLLQSTVISIKRQKSVIESVRDSESTVTLDKIKAVKAAMTAGLADIKEALKKYEEMGKQQVNPI